MSTYHLPDHVREFFDEVDKGTVTDQRQVVHMIRHYLLSSDDAEFLAHHEWSVDDVIHGWNAFSSDPYDARNESLRIEGMFQEWNTRLGRPQFFYGPLIK